MSPHIQLHMPPMFLPPLALSVPRLGAAGQAAAPPPVNNTIRLGDCSSWQLDPEEVVVVAGQ